MLLGGAKQCRVGGRPLEVQVRLVFPREPDSAEHLDGVARDAAERRRTRRLRDARGEFGIVGAVRQRPHRVVRRRAGVLQVDEHVSQPVLDCLERPDGSPELQSLLGVLHGQVEQVLRGADLLGREQRRTHLQRMGNDAFAIGGPCDKPRGRVVELDGGLGPGQVDGDQGRARDARPCCVDRIKADPVGPLGRDKEIVRGAGVDHPLGRSGKAVARRR